MADKSPDAETIKETDIVFDCPFCNKSLAIDYRGAGLTIPCTDCGKRVQVPIPDGLELSDFDSSEEEQELRIMHLRKALASAHAKIAALESEVGTLTRQRDGLEEFRTSSLYKFQTFNDRIGVIQTALSQLSGAVSDIAQMLSAD